MVIRELHLEDLEFLLEIRNHISTRNYLENNSIFTLDECKKWFKTLEFPWYIIEVEGKKVGYIRTSFNTVGIDIHIEERNKGYATEAYKLYLETKDKVFLWVFSDNSVGIYLYEKLGFKYTGNSKIIRNKIYVEMIWKKS
jgi:RimJ/RimL family protein N-acetyltransferase